MHSIGMLRKVDAAAAGLLAAVDHVRLGAAPHVLLARGAIALAQAAGVFRVESDLDRKNPAVELGLVQGLVLRDRAAQLILRKTGCAGLAEDADQLVEVLGVLGERGRL